MPKGCSKCETQNDDAAVFCRACGTPFAVPAPEPSPGLDCSACGHTNRISASFCAKCGNDLSEQTIIRPRAKAAAQTAAPELPTPPPAAPQPPPPPPLPSPARHTSDAGDTTQPAPLSGAVAVVAPKRSGLPIAAGVLAVVVLAGAAWWLLGSRVDMATPAAQVAPPPPQALPAAPPAAPPVVAPAPEPAAVAPAPVAVEAAPPAVDTAEAKRLADEQAAQDLEARNKLTRDTAAREAKTKAQREQREVNAQAQRDAARQRAEEARARTAPAPAAAPRAATPAPAAAPAPAPAVAPQPRTAREICAGGNAIIRSICESRECGRAEHAEEPACKQVNAAEERRRQSQNN